MSDAPKRIWAWPHFDGWITGDWSANTYHDERAVAYILAAEHDRIVAEKDAEIARLREALDDIAAWMDDPEGPNVGGVHGAKAIARAALRGGDNG